MSDSSKELEGNKLLTTADTATILNIKPDTLKAWRHYKRTDLPFVKIGHLVRYRRADVQKFIKSKMQLEVKP